MEGKRERRGKKACMSTSIPKRILLSHHRKNLRKSLYLPLHPPTSPSLPTHALPHQSRVPDEEDGCVVSNQVPVSILSVKLHCKPTRIPHCVRTSRLTTCCMRGKMGKNGYAKLYAQRVHPNMSEAFKL